MSPFHTKFRYAHKNTNMCWEFYWKLSSWNFITEVFFPPFLFCLFKLEVSCKTNVCALKPAVCVGLIQWLTHSRILRSAELHWNKGYAFRLSLESSVRIGTGAQYFEKKKNTKWSTWIPLISTAETHLTKQICVRFFIKCYPLLSPAAERVSWVPFPHLYLIPLFPPFSIHFQCEHSPAFVLMFSLSNV